MDQPVRLAPRGALCGLTHTQIDHNRCLSSDLSTARERLAVRLCLADGDSRRAWTSWSRDCPVHAFGPGEAIDARSTVEAGNGGHRRSMSYRRRRRYRQGSSRRSDRRRTGSDHWNAILRHDSRQGYRQNAGLDVLESLQHIGNESTGRLRRRAPALHATSKGHGPRGHDSWTSRDRRRRGRTTISTRRTPPMPPLQPAWTRDAAKPGTA